MKNRATTLAVCCALTAASLFSSAPASAQIPSFALAGVGQLGGMVLSPATFYAIGSNPVLWNALAITFGPEVQPYSEGFRQLTIRPPITLRPTAIPPNPPAQVFPNSYTQVISFGDSMSDTGNLFGTLEQFGGRGIPVEPNHRGRFSDGVVVVEAMANALNRPLVNYAFAGARSGTDNLVPLRAMQQGMLKQIQDFVDTQSSWFTPVDANALYVLWTGPDDYYADGNIFDPTTGSQIAANISKGMAKLYARGARHFFVPQMPDLSITPSAHTHNKTLPNYLSNAKARSAEFAVTLSNTLQTFARRYPQAVVHTFETYTYSQQRLAQAAAEGNNVTEPCYRGMTQPMCTRPDKYLFWDTNHPTAAGSTVIGTDFAKSVVNDAPLPSR